MEFNTKAKNTEILRDTAKLMGIYNISDHVRKQLHLTRDHASQISLLGVEWTRTPAAGLWNPGEETVLPTGHSQPKAVLLVSERCDPPHWGLSLQAPPWPQLPFLGPHWLLHDFTSPPSFPVSPSPSQFCFHPPAVLCLSWFPLHFPLHTCHEVGCTLNPIVESLLGAPRITK